METEKIQVAIFSTDTLGMPTLAEIDNTLKGFKDVIKCDTMQGLSSRRVAGLTLDIYLDDNGKLFGQDTITALFVHQNKVIDFIVGNFILCTHDEDGDARDFPVDSFTDLISACIPGESLKTPSDFKWKINDNLLVIDC